MSISLFSFSKNWFLMDVFQKTLTLISTRLLLHVLNSVFFTSLHNFFLLKQINIMKNTDNSSSTDHSNFLFPNNVLTTVMRDTPL